MFTRVVLPSIFFVLALVAGIGMYAFTDVIAPRGNPLLTTTGTAPQPVPIGNAPLANNAPAAPASEPGTREAPAVGRPESRQVTLYVSLKSDMSKLVPLVTAMDTAPGTRDLVDRVVGALQGPFDDPNVVPTVPKGTKLLSVFLARKQMIINLSRDIETLHSGGMQASRATIYSLVNSLVDLGLAEEIKILVQGREEPAFMDHLDLTRPLTFDTSMVLTKQAEPPPEPAAPVTPAGGTTAAGRAAGNGR